MGSKGLVSENYEWLLVLYSVEEPTDKSIVSQSKVLIASNREMLPKIFILNELNGVE